MANYSQRPKQYPNIVSWQYSSKGNLSGAIGDLDMDYFNDSIFTGSVPSGSTVINNNFNHTPSVVRNNDVANLQDNLNHLLNWDITVDGINGNETKTATRQLQEMVRIGIDGIAGPQTNSAINSIMVKPTLRHGSSGKAVEFIQYRLGIVNDGVYGDNTKNAVIEWQRNHALEVDGIIGDNTWRSFLGL